MVKRVQLALTKFRELSGFVPKNLNLDIVDDVEQVNSEDAFEMARKLSLEKVFWGDFNRSYRYCCSSNRAKPK